MARKSRIASTLKGEKMINIKNLDLDEIELNKDLNYLFHELLKFSTKEWIYFKFPFNNTSLRIESILDKIDKIIYKNNT